MKRLLGWALAFLLALLPSLGRAELAAEEKEAADAYFSRAFSRAGAVGGAVIVNRQGERLYSFFYGAGDKKGSRPVDEDTVYKVASVTKLISAIGVMQLKEAGKLDLDAPLTYGGLQPIRNPRYPDAPITLRQVMSHTSSFLPSAPYISPPPWDQLGPKDTRYFSKQEPGAYYAYANLNGGMLCSAVERASGQSLNAYMTEHVFAPLGINAAYAAHLLPDASALSNTYMQDGLLYKRAEKYIQEDADSYDDTCSPDSHYNVSVGSLYISLRGLEKLGQALACRGRAGDVLLLSPEAAEEMRQDQTSLPGSSVKGESPYGLCMYRFTGEDGVSWWGHQGRWEGLLVDLFVEPKSHTAVVFVMNGVKRSGAGEVDAKAARALLRVDEWLKAIEGREDIGFVVEDEEQFP